jgi:biotin carboxylase
MKHVDPRRIVIVDGYSTGRELVRELLDRNVECLHLQSTEQLPAPVVKSFDRSPYDGDLGYVGDAAAAVDVLSTLKPHAVVAGSEWGVTLAEQIAHGMGLPTNRIEKISARRDKFEMIEAARRHGLRVAEQASVATVEAAHTWAERQAAWPIVVKPMTSAGSDGVTICNSHADIDAAFAKAFGRENFLGCFNERLLMQSFLSGPQYIVNTVSRHGRHYVTDAWHMTLSTERGSELVPQEAHLLDPRPPTANSLITYTLGVLKALGIENGAAHTELKWTTQGPALIETGARLMGAAMDRPSYCAAGMETQASIYATSLARSDGERSDLFQGRHYSLKRLMTKLLFSFEQAGEIRGVEGLARLRGLASFHAHYRPLAKGDKVWKTADTLACGGVVYLVHDDRSQIASDIEAIRAWEKRGELYDVAPFGAQTGERS